MREKKLMLVVAFPNTTNAMAMENMLQTAGCGRKADRGSSFYYGGLRHGMVRRAGSGSCGERSSERAVHRNRRNLPDSVIRRVL